MGYRVVQPVSSGVGQGARCSMKAGGMGYRVVNPLLGIDEG